MPLIRGIFVACAVIGLSKVVADPPDDPIVELTTGKIRGRTVRTANGNEGIAFLGIPFADPPLGKLRFAPPAEKQPWRGVLDCRQYGPACASNSSRTTSPQSVISEDCLTANVFVSAVCLAAFPPCPVLLYIHGGGFMYDTPRMFPEHVLVDNFAARDLVFVTLAFRLGALGAFSTGTAAARGNYHMQDIAHGLRWLKREAVNVGGDPRAITIMGHSSGAEAVSLLTLSPKTGGLFARAVQMSGTSLRTKEVLDTAHGFSVSRAFATRAQCAAPEQFWPPSERRSVEIVACLRRKSAEEMLAIQRRMDDEGLLIGEPIQDGADGLFPTTADRLAETRRGYPLLTGTTANEFRLPAEILQTEGAVRDECVRGAETLQFAHPQAIADNCTQFYAAEGADATLDMQSDTGQFVPTYLEALSMTAVSPGRVYLYSFDYERANTTDFGRHSKDLTFIMGIHPFKFSAEDRRIQRIYSGYFADFAKSGDPTPRLVGSRKWQPLKSSRDSNYYSVDYSEKPGDRKRSQTLPDYHQNAIKFWTKTAPKIDSMAEDSTPSPGEAGQNPAKVENSDTDNTADKNTTKEVQNDESSQETACENCGNWQTAFWVTLGVLILLIILFTFIFGVQKFSQRRQPSDDAHETPVKTVDEKTPLIAAVEHK